MVDSGILILVTLLNLLDNMKHNQWTSYTLIDNESINDFINTLYKKRSENSTLFIMGKGFDIRMNNVIKDLLSIDSIFDVKIDCLCIEIQEGKSITNTKNKEYTAKNEIELEKLFSLHKNVNYIPHKIDIWKTEKKKKRRVGDRNGTTLINDILSRNRYSNIIIDISAMSRSIYFSIIGSILLNIRSSEDRNCNFFVVVSENIEIDQKVVDEGIDREAYFLHGFGMNSESTLKTKPSIWFPILGENKREQVENAYNTLNPIEVCPLLPFPSKNPRRSDNLLIEYYKFLFERIGIETQNLMFIPEQNAFETYRIITNAIKNYENSLDVINGCCGIISAFSSKLLSIGALLAGFDLKHIQKYDVGILSVDSHGYVIQDYEEMIGLNLNSKTVLMQLTYSNNE